MQLAHYETINHDDDWVNNGHFCMPIGEILLLRRKKITPTGGGGPVGVICNDRRFGRRRIASPIGLTLGGGVRRPNFHRGIKSRGHFISERVPDRSNRRDQENVPINRRISILRSHTLIVQCNMGMDDMQFMHAFFLVGSNIHIRI
jgi:hypothetical protein